MSASPIDSLMQQASERLTGADYVGCERLCLQAIEQALDQEDYERLGRILLPLQEARRQRRQAAADSGVVRVFDAEPARCLDDILQAVPQGCVLLADPPYDEDAELALRRTVRERGLHVEVLRLARSKLANFFEDLVEAQGDALLAELPRDLSAEQEVAALTALLDRVGDHEIAHQRLAEAARRAARQRAQHPSG